MRLCICGNGEREKCLRTLCLSRGHSLPESGAWDAVVLPLPRSDIDEELADQLPRGQTVICGLTGPKFDAMAEKRGWRLKRVLKDEAYVAENARLTAEGAVWAAMVHADRAVCGAECLVIGYGRIGKALTGMLSGLGAKATVAARRKESRDEAGEGSVSIEETACVLPRMDLVFNTVPSPVLGREELKAAQPNALLIELASAPYGIDREAAEQLGLNVYLESALPGRYCPRSAAEALLRYVEREGRT